LSQILCLLGHFLSFYLRRPVPRALAGRASSALILKDYLIVPYR
jgi:hypothetical protein